jgi:hypothetical protein
MVWRIAGIKKLIKPKVAPDSRTFRPVGIKHEGKNRMRNEGFRIALLDAKGGSSWSHNRKVLSMHGSKLDDFRDDQEFPKVFGKVSHFEPRVALRGTRWMQ